MSGIGIGKLIESQSCKDAIHVAVMPVIADSDLTPGQHVGFTNGVTEAVGDSETQIGIVDPFLPHAVKKGERFWMFLYPGSITSLRHDWSHPAVDAQQIASGVDAWRSAADPEGEHRRAIEYEADRIGLSYGALMSAAAQFVATGERYVGGSEMEGVYLNHDFWEHYEVVMNTKVPPGDKESFFSCAC